MQSHFHCCGFVTNLAAMVLISAGGGSFPVGNSCRLSSHGFLCVTLVSGCWQKTFRRLLVHRVSENGAFSEDSNTRWSEEMNRVASRQEEEHSRTLTVAKQLNGASPRASQHKKVPVRNGWGKKKSFHCSGALAQAEHEMKCNSCPLAKLAVSGAMYERGRKKRGRTIPRVFAW